MKHQNTHVAALALAGALAVTAATPSFADNRWGYAAGGFAAGALVGAAAANANAGYYYGPTYDPENGSPDPDSRIGGSFKMNTSGDD